MAGLLAELNTPVQSHKTTLCGTSGSRDAGEARGRRSGFVYPAVEDTFVEKLSLTALAREQLKIARHASSGRSAHTVYGGHEHVLRQTVIALAAGHGLDEHDNPGEATVHVLHGRVRLSSGDVGWEGSPGDLLIVPAARHALEALEDSAVLLTVAKHGYPDPTSHRPPAG